MAGPSVSWSMMILRAGMSGELFFEPDVFVIMESERRFFPAAHGSLHEGGASAPINGRDGRVVEQVGFGFLERGVAAGGIELGVGGVDERVVGGVGPAGAVDAVTRGKNGEVGERVGIFGGPFAAGEGVVAGLVVDGGEEHFEFFLETYYI